MRLNNKGFAITATIYGLLVLFLIVLLSILASLKFRITSAINMTDSIEKSLFFKKEVAVADSGFITEYKAIVDGKYYFDTNSSSNCYVYLLRDSTLKVNGNKLQIDGVSSLYVGNCSNSGITNFKMKKYYSVE